MTQEKIRQAYTEYVLDNGKEPESVYAFGKKLKLKEEDFYNEYSSFAQIESDIWKALFIEARAATEREEVYQNYSVREKLLAFLYTWIETLKKNRSYILKSYEGFDKPIYTKRNVQLVDFKSSFYDYLSELLMEARETREVEQRPIPQLMQRYPDLFWAKTLFILDFWIKDTSKSFEKTDTMIEKTVNTAFDLLGRSPLDSLFDLGKFIFQNRK
jgi:hypothetical protein